MEVRILQTAIASLYMTHRGRLSREWEEKLEIVKHNAQSGDDRDIAIALLPT